VLIPAANVQHLMLRPDVVEAAAAGRFSVIPIDSIDQGIELLTGLPAGAADATGTYAEGTVNRRIAARLAAFARRSAAAPLPRPARPARRHERDEDD
jgi:predicted ATP-dependent protease